MGRVPADQIFKNVTYLDVFSCEWRKGDVAIADGVIVGLEPGLTARETIDAKGKWLVPGFIDAHVHVESSLLLPGSFQDAVLAKGTTSAVCDPHELANVMGPSGIEYFLNASQSMRTADGLDLWVMLSSCVPATHMETNGGGTITSAQLAALKNHPRALGLAEMMNMPGVLHNDEEVMKKIEAFADRRIDGHAPLLRGRELSAYACTGISSCHESSELEEAREKLIKGISVWIREGSVAKDLEALAPLLTLGTSTTLGFCTDDRNPLDIAEQGHVDYLIRGAIRHGVAPEVAFRAASWSVARHYALDRGPARVGAIAPGYGADLVLLDDARSVSLSRVMKRGRWAESLGPAGASSGASLGAGSAAALRGTVRAHAPEARDLEGPGGRVHVIEVIEGKIITGRRVASHDAPGVARLSVLERYGRGTRPANGYVSGFGEGFRGAIASSVGHDSHNLIAVGSESSDMRAAMSALISSGGGFCVVKNGSVLAHLPLPYGGLMSDREPAFLKGELAKLRAASRETGCALAEPFLQLAFLSLPVIPSLKLTDQGLVDVDQFKIVDVRAG